MTTRIVPARREQFDALRRIELACFETLRAAGAVSGPATASSDAGFQASLDDGLLFAAVDETGDPVGFAAARIAGDALHIAEIDIHPDWQRRGIGRRLIECLLGADPARHLARATLTTDRFAAFNLPFYASLGFREVAPGDCPRLQAILTAEARHGLDPRRRAAMELRL